MATKQNHKMNYDETAIIVILKKVRCLMFTCSVWYCQWKDSDLRFLLDYCGDMDDDTLELIVMMDVDLLWSGTGGRATGGARGNITLPHPRNYSTYWSHRHLIVRPRLPRDLPDSPQTLIHAAHPHSHYRFIQQREWKYTWKKKKRISQTYKTDWEFIVPCWIIMQRD